MAHKKCLKKMREHIWCDCINDDLEELKRLRKLMKEDFLRRCKESISKRMRTWGTRN